MGKLVDRGSSQEQEEIVDGDLRPDVAGFLFTNLLIDILVASKATIVNTSSVGAHAFGHIDLTDLDYTGKYKVMKAYGDSKLANILFAKGLTSRYQDQSLNAVAIHPGNISSNFGKETGNGMMKFIYKTPRSRMLSTPESGADNLIWAMDGEPGVTWASGQYYNEHREPLKKPNPQQNDAALADALWVESARRVGLPVNA